MPDATQIHFISRSEGTLCDSRRSGGIQDLSKVTCEVCLRVLQKIKETWVYNPSAVAPPERLSPHVDNKSSRGAIILTGPVIFSKEKGIIQDVQRMLDCGNHRLERIGLRGSSIGGYKLKLDSSQQKNAMILYSEAQKVFVYQREIF
jgi:hypothetical protein